MELTRGLFPKLLVGTFVVAILSFVVRGFSQLAVGQETAQVLSAPFFVLAFGLAVLAFVLSVLVQLGVVDTDA
ncbi:hypothetical protein SAMN05216226_10335 [Halovenus aranensis]|jgi:hypothetical protein|uniref:Uncharacterized protein n=1 Tax=Halovenus aranensis TaxID=890420 RepID=A0A1G8TF93_9EURY|nr:hypothetical protein [Halovenus aranensis]SDJ40181.1 hypothetical protein SAMN05216226_10335 [Halovenus aranensis]